MKALSPRKSSFHIHNSYVDLPQLLCPFMIPDVFFNSDGNSFKGRCGLVINWRRHSSLYHYLTAVLFILGYASWLLSGWHLAAWRMKHVSGLPFNTCSLGDKLHKIFYKDNFVSPHQNWITCIGVCCRKIKGLFETSELCRIPLKKSTQ